MDPTQYCIDSDIESSVCEGDLTGQLYSPRMFILHFILIPVFLFNLWDKLLITMCSQIFDLLVSFNPFCSGSGYSDQWLSLYGALLTLIQPEERRGEGRKTIISIDMTELSETVSQWTLDNIQDRKPPPLVTSVMLLLWNMNIMFLDVTRYHSCTRLSASSSVT